jgi:hypothetical protein
MTIQQQAADQHMRATCGDTFQQHEEVAGAPAPQYRYGMFWNLLLLLVAILVVTLIRDGYREKPRWLTRGGGPPMSVPSRWILGPYLMVLALVAIPTTRESIPKLLHPIIVFAFVPVWLLVALVEHSDLLFRKRGKRFSGLNSREQRKLRREKKQLRLRRTQARRHG